MEQTARPACEKRPQHEPAVPLCRHDFGVCTVARAWIFGSAQSNSGHRHGSQRDIARGLASSPLALFGGKPKAPVLYGAEIE